MSGLEERLPTASKEIERVTKRLQLCQSPTTQAKLIWIDSPRDPYGSLGGQACPLDARLEQQRTELLATQDSGSRESTTSSCAVLDTST